MSSPSNRKKKKMDKATRKMLLVKLVKNEMMSAWDGQEEEVQETEKPSAPTSANQPNNVAAAGSSADMFYAMMNGERAANAPSSSLNEHDPRQMREFDGSDDERTRNTFDQRSFTALIFDEEKKRPKSPSKKKSRRASTSSAAISVNSLARTNSVDNFDVLSGTGNEESIGTTRLSQSGSGNGSSDMNSDSETGLSVREIEEIVMANMPKHVLDQIPREAWSTIFKNNGLTGSSNVSEEEYDMENDEEFMVDDDCTEVSDITGPTLYKMMENGVQSPKTKRDTRWESDDAPPELIPTGWASDSHSGVDEAGVPIHRSTKSTNSNSNSNRVDFAGQVQAVTMQPTAKKENLKVSFDTVDIRYYERILDINPAVTNGAAIGIGWRYKRGGRHPVEEWESKRGAHRPANDLLLPRHVREALLKDLGYSQADIAAAVRVIFKAKNKRKQTVQNLNAESVEEVVESAARRVKNILSLGKKKGLVKK
ncbi:MAG: hypothetical protein SGILL_008818 [Bacillariaceae sp.]